MAIAIFTKYIGPTNTQGSRVKAYTGDTAPGKTRADYVTISGGGAVTRETHIEAAKMLAERLGWDGTWIAGGHGGGDYVFVRSGDDRDNFAVVE